MVHSARLEGVDVFVEVVNARSFTRAAARMGMPATTVSARIKRLEERLGTTLLRRTTRKLSLTDAGERYYAHCVHAMEAVLEGERAVATTLEEPRGRLRITAPADLAQSVLVPAISAYLARYPAVTIDLLVSNHYRDLVGEGIDLAVRVGALADSSLIVRQFFTSSIGLWAAPAYLASAPPIRKLEDLLHHRLIRIQTGRRGLELHDVHGSIPVDDCPGNLLVDDMLTCQAFAESGIGIALLPLFSQSTTGEPARLIRVLPDVSSEPFAVHFLYPRHSIVPPTVRSFIDLALRSAGG
jgi:DNA-binding transcriptional LysR family regulator